MSGGALCRHCPGPRRRLRTEAAEAAAALDRPLPPAEDHLAAVAAGGVRLPAAVSLRWTAAAKG